MKENIIRIPLKRGLWGDIILVKIDNRTKWTVSYSIDDWAWIFVDTDNYTVWGNIRFLN